MKHLQSFESFLGEAKVTGSNDKRFGHNTSIVESNIFGKLNIETNVIPTTKSERDYEPIEGSVTVTVKVGGVGSLTSDTKSYQVTSKEAKDISTKLKARFDANDYKSEIPELEKMKEEVHKFEVDLFVKGLTAFEDDFTKKEYK